VTRSTFRASFHGLDRWRFLEGPPSIEYSEFVPCPRIDDCPLFPQFVLKQNLHFWKRHYCEDEFDECARLQLQREGKNVPETMLPNGKEIKVVLRKGQVRPSED
jgi:hypothetical protein